MAKQKRNRKRNNQQPKGPTLKVNQSLDNQQKLNPYITPADVERIPISYQEIINLFQEALKVSGGKVNPITLREETIRRIEQLTKRPLLCYTTQRNSPSPQATSYIYDGDLTGFTDLIRPIQGEDVDIFIVSNGGSAEATERIVNLLRGRFKNIRFFVPANAYSAATLMCFSGDEIIMDICATLGPIDPQINGVPARAILRGFENIEERLKNEDPKALAAYIPLLEKYDLHILELCKSAQELSKELAENWLTTYMLKTSASDSVVDEIVKFFSDYDTHKSHSRSINRNMAKEKGLRIINSEDIEGLSDLLQSLHNQYLFFFDKTPFYKLYENSRGISWGQQWAEIAIPIEKQIPQSIPEPKPGTPAKPN